MIGKTMANVGVVLAAVLALTSIANAACEGLSAQALINCLVRQEDEAEGLPPRPSCVIYCTPEENAAREKWDRARLEKQQQKYESAKQSMDTIAQVLNFITTGEDMGKPNSFWFRKSPCVYEHKRCPVCFGGLTTIDFTKINHASITFQVMASTYRNGAGDEQEARTLETRSSHDVRRTTAFPS